MIYTQLRNAITVSSSPSMTTEDFEIIPQFDYAYDAAGRRVSIVKSGSAFGDLLGSIDSYTYNARSELTSARRMKNGQSIPGFSEDFDYDPIGNRRSSATYNEKGEPQTSTYQANNLNQYTSRTTPGYAAVRGEADHNAFVTVNENPAFRFGSYFFGSDLFDNTAAGGLANLETYATLGQSAANGEEAEDLISAETNQVYIAQSPETFAYDDDGNQTLITTKTGLWRVTYNGENRPVRWTKGNTVVTMSYDHMGRRRAKNNQRFFYDGYLQVADNVGNVYTWDCTETVATRPLVWRNSALDTSHPALYYAHDGNKNISEVIAADCSPTAHYDYASFGSVIAQRGIFAATNPWRFSSEYAEDDTATVYYNYRHYEPVSGRWMQMDPIFEDGGANLNSFVKNYVLSYVDLYGLSIGKSNWFTKRGHTHEELTTAAYPFDKKNPLLCLTDDSILNVLIESNVETDSGDTGDQQQYHYCTGLKHVYSWSYDFAKYKKDYSDMLTEKLHEFTKNIAKPNKSNCNEALNVLGTLTHMWQDYYSHGVKDDGWFIGKEGEIAGSPDNPQMIPDSYGWYGFRGGHGGLFRLLNPFTRVEPGDRAKDSEERRKQAVKFVKKKLSDLLPKWAASCCCEWRKSK